MMRFLARCLTGAGFFALGGDALHFAETGGRTPYTLAWIEGSTAMRESTPALAALTGQGTLFGALPLSLFLLWLGAVAFIMAGRRSR